MLEYTRAPPGIQREPDQRDQSGQHNQLVENEPHEKACADGGAASPNVANAAAAADDRIEQNEPKYAVNIKKDKKEHHDGCQQSHDPGQKLRIEKRILTLQQQEMVAAAASLGKSAAGDIESTSADLTGKESHDRHAPPKTPAEGREQLRFGPLEGGGDDLRRS